MMKAVMCKEAGGPEVLELREVPKPVPGQGQVLLKVHYTAINRADTLQRKGGYAPPPGASQVLGLEAAGEVVDLGQAVDGWKVGDQAMALLSGGGNAEYVAVLASHLLRVPAEIIMEKAGAIPEVWLTAYQLLHFVGQIQEGDTVLVHAGGSGVGTAAVQLVKRAGGRSLVTAGSQAKIDLAVELGADRGVNYKTEDFQAKVQEWTAGKGVNVILDCVGGSYSNKNLGSLAVDGRWVVYGLMGGAEVSGPLLAGLLRKRASIRGTTLRARNDAYKAKLVAAFAKDCLPGFSDESLKPVVDSVFDIKVTKTTNYFVIMFQDIGDAHRKMEANTNTGKIVLKV